MSVCVVQFGHDEPVAVEPDALVISGAFGWEARSHFETCPSAAEFSRGKR